MGHKVILLTFDETAGLTDENETRTQGDLTTVILKASYQHYLQNSKRISGRVVMGLRDGWRWVWR
ncbi:MAG: hypothetical protein IPN29_09545 [Saprospiraceae bacterium]|nr:hypothetical protein [Saprospiraceae bacterium]